MRIEINPATGLITVETNDNSSAAEFVRELVGGQKPLPAPKAIESGRVTTPKKPRRRRRKLAPARADRPLTKAEDETWAWMGANDRPEGISAEEVAQAFGISVAGGTWRIGRLVKRDMAWRCGTGRYRVGSLTDGAIISSNGAVLSNGSRVH